MSKVRTLCLATLCFAAAHCSVFAAASALPSTDALVEKKHCAVKKSRITTNHIFAYNDNSSTLSLSEGAYVPFNTVPLVDGCTIKQLNPTTFQLQPGDYLVDFAWDLVSAASQIFKLVVNGAVQKPGGGISMFGFSQIVRITVKDSILQMQVTGSGTVVLNSPTAATIAITQLS